MISNAIHEMQPMQCNPCNATHATQPMQYNPCNATRAMQPMCNFTPCKATHTTYTVVWVHGCIAVWMNAWRMSVSVYMGVCVYECMDGWARCRRAKLDQIQLE